ncbi:MAG: ATP-binding cassette domain-containing protein [Chloroflexi bacterium]|nr:ATP-binding cassette domain-containing protein [Chloroflexota bacterium]MCY3938378.1 ATP-binding cassette domain-containing protein [Chloroflexota bacterium]
MTSVAAMQPAVRAVGLRKRFGNLVAVNDVSLSVSPGEVVGLVGPNGSGKTTTIRMLLDILRPDEGRVSIFGADLTAQATEQIGYLPEERGLYRGLRVIPTLVYLARLKGMSQQDALDRAGEVLSRLGLEPHQNKKIRELSRGLGQLVQLAATVMHKPRFLVLDEPFSGLDPVNVRLIKDFIAELSGESVAIMLSTHQMTDVEELCDRVIMINKGSVVLDGGLAEIRRRFASGELFVASRPAPEGLEGVIESRADGAGHALRLAVGQTPEGVLRQLLDRGASIDRFEPATPSLEQIFVRVVKEGRG